MNKSRSSPISINTHVSPYLCGCRFYSTKDSILEKFWDSFHSKLLDDMKHYSRSNESNVSQYQDTVLNILHDNKENKDSFTEEDFIHVQTLIEESTTLYDDLKNIFQLTPDLINIIISKDKPTAKEYLKSSKLSYEDLSSIEYFDPYTLEAIIIYVLGLLFHCIQERPAVRVSTLIEHLDTYVRSQAKLLKERIPSMKKWNSEPSMRHVINSDNTSSKEKVKAKGKEQAKDKTKKVINNQYAIGVLLVEFLVNRELISLSTELSFQDLYSVTKKKGKYYIPRNLYAICNFDISLLPIKLNLPMICKPLDWKAISNEKPSSLSDLRGGYLSMPTGDFYQQQRYRVITSRDLNHFQIVLQAEYTDLCSVMNGLQAQAFEINKDVLSFIKINYDLLVKNGLFMPRYLASLNINRAVDLLRNSYLENKDLTNVCNYQDLLKLFMVRIQRARYETFIINLASAYDGYQFYLPAFVDFRGRIYRSGVLHFHERDLARSLIVFSGKNTSYEHPFLRPNIEDAIKVVASAAAFHYKKFESYKDSYQWYLDHVSMKASSDESIIELALSASDPYQFISKVLCIESDNKTNLIKIPITQDASASAYQIMSYFLLNTNLALKTNLIPHLDSNKSSSYDINDQKINDIYTFFLEELKDHFHKDLSDNLYDIVCPRLTRKLVKVLFMPMIYGKTVISMANDIHQHFSSLLDKKECMLLAKSVYDFFIKNYPGIVNFMDLIRDVGWLASAMDRPVLYSVPLFTTMQDYMKTKTVNIWIYDRIHRKRRQVTLRIPSDDRDRRKTHMSTFANFIHQKDAYIAMKMIMEILFLNLPFYTVHDNFITTAPYALYISHLYIKVITNLRSPLLWINKFIDINLLQKNLYAVYTLESPVPPTYLRDSLLLHVLPTNINKSKELIWLKKICRVCIAYEKYVIDVYDYNSETKDSECLNNTSAFITKMMKWYYYDYNYSLHL